MSLYCSECDKVHAFPPFRDKPKKCPDCGSQLCFYTRIEEAPVRRRCANCSFLDKVTCGVTSFTPESIFLSDLLRQILAEKPSKMNQDWIKALS